MPCSGLAVHILSCDLWKWPVTSNSQETADNVVGGVTSTVWSLWSQTVSWVSLWPLLVYINLYDLSWRWTLWPASPKRSRILSKPQLLQWRECQRAWRMHFLRSIPWNNQWQTQLLQPFQIEAERDQRHTESMLMLFAVCMKKVDNVASIPGNIKSSVDGVITTGRKCTCPRLYTTFQNAWQFLLSVRDFTAVCFFQQVPKKTHTHTSRL